MLYNNIISIKEDLSTRHRDKKYLSRFYINMRLNESLNNYYKQLESSVNYLENRKPENVIKEL